VAHLHSALPWEFRPIYCAAVSSRCRPGVQNGIQKPTSHRLADEPYVRKVRIVMAEKRIEHHLDLEDVWAPDSKIQEANPLGKVPCLIMEDGGQSSIHA